VALSNVGLKGRIISELETQGFDTGNEHSMAVEMATAIANAVVAEIEENAEIATSGGHPWYGGTHDHVHGPGTIK